MYYRRFTLPAILPVTKLSAHPAGFAALLVISSVHLFHTAAYLSVPVLWYDQLLTVTIGLVGPQFYLAYYYVRTLN